jgi:hypothetical protein
MGSPEYLRSYYRDQTRQRRARHGRQYETREDRRWKEKTRPYRTYLCARARMRGRKMGLVATIRPEELVWPEFCPVLGMRLYYPERDGTDRSAEWLRPDRASLDRWDNSKGYVAGNVFVISMRANLLKNNATARELAAVARYTKYGAKVISDLPLFSCERVR